ncbi:hypothetical protein ONS95_006486 [Cadophora gregata]|uniref:uncharacterized protein n=1 Tax=Cadophora gregata TaxID=51156 RepID=UPI0026DC9C33|nr:uncharacterized protein ONS95_006486 [Cadophora gregata]KAK0101309.1 hypothetical protein ONS95_006486 [Cadophora gregata]
MPRTFWIDAVCIDQSNMAERSEQVSKMRTIYHSANYVVVWLGPDDDSSALAFSMFKRFRRHMHDVQYIANIIKSPASRDSLEAIVSLFSRAYWDRVWVIQEVNSIEETEIIIMCGNHNIGWSALAAKQDMLIEDHQDLLMELSGQEPRLRSLYNDMRLRGPNGLQLPYTIDGTPDLYTLLSLYWKSAATDPKDKIYALVGLSTARDDPRLSIDYSLSIRQAYINVARYLVVSSQKLDVICSMPRCLNTYDLPSWVPDWTAYKMTPISPCIAIAQFFAANRLTPYSAAGESEPDVEFSDAADSLITNGFCLGNIVSVGQKCRENPAKDMTAGVIALADWFRLLGSAGEITQAKASTFCSTILFDHLTMGPEWFETRAQHVETILGDLANEAQERCPDEVIHPYLLDMQSRPRPVEVTTKPWVSDACKLIAYRRFFISSSGLMGLAPDSAEPGDIICILLGCFMPVILRPMGRHYILLGGAYYHEYMYGKGGPSYHEHMNGRGMTELAQGKFKLEPFEIQ